MLLSFWIGIASLTILVAAAVLATLPGRIENRTNRTLPLPPKPPSPRALALHRSLVVADLHADSLLWGRDLLSRSARGHVDIPRLIDGNVALQAFTIVTRFPRRVSLERNADDTDRVLGLVLAQRWPPRTWFNLTERALYQVSRLHAAEARSHGRFTIIRSAADLSNYLAQRAVDQALAAGILGIEGAHALCGRPELVDRFYDVGVRMMSPTHFTDNAMAGSAHGMHRRGLTEAGREMVRRMEARRMIVDLAHASARTIDDVLALASRPVIVSHTGVKGTYDNARNLSDAQLKAIAGAGGLIGIGYWNTAVGGRDAAAIARAICYTADLVGVDQVALGSDFDGATTVPFDTSGVVRVTDALLQAGTSDTDVGKIVGGNSVRFLLNALE